MYENYLLNASAISAVLNAADKDRPTPVTTQAVSDWLEADGKRTKFIKVADESDWLHKVDAAQLLDAAFTALSGTRVSYDKVKHGLKLTEWIIKNSPGDLDELVTFLKGLLERSDHVGPIL
jgi:hypothetical protein